MKSTKYLIYLAVFSLLFSSACTDDDALDPTPIATNCKPIKFTDEEGVSLITYNQDKITSLKTQYYGIVTIEYHTSGATNGKPSKLTFSAGDQGAGHLEYTYNPQGKVSSSLFTSQELSEMLGGSFQSNFEYNGSGQISKVSRVIVFAGEPGEAPTAYPVGYSTYEYNAKGNVTLVKDYDDGESTPTTVNEITYDDKINATAQVENLLIGIPGLPPASPNNALTSVMKEGGTVNKSESYTNTYVYNSGGYPTKITRTPQQGTPNVTSIEYSCQ
ncbi:hypothetical protein TH63_11455 [Rufibacter radiotolerans]|uniref:DUF4595 domain-containing protein n=1 Tax=Rufibacter radiotolerans TaxID=1379910 RepID=A0A0H4W6R3_9BACT|nr:hypothetical protein [Rufibacter radiotolerans]AKQ46106.1 hypothetical protein TH63_11455 [Rufibacter radiotolerans]